MFIFKYAGQTLNESHFWSRIGDTAPLSMFDGNATATANKLVEPNDFRRKPVVYYPLYKNNTV
jgi:hypothetical protein